MKHLLYLTVFLVFPLTAVLGSITNLQILNSGIYLQDDSIKFSYNSTVDTTLFQVWIETGDTTSGFNSALDKRLAVVMLIDNGVAEIWHEDQDSGLMRDSNPAKNAYQFGPMRADLAPAFYHLLVYDSDDTAAQTFRVNISTPVYRTISGKITVPQNESAAWIEVRAGFKEREGRYSTYTDSSGNYKISINDSALAAQANGKARVEVDAEFDGYLPDPPNQNIDVSINNANNIDFEFIQATCAIKGRVTAESLGISKIVVGLRNDSLDMDAGRTTTDDSGYFFIHCLAGSYRLDLRSEDILPKYFIPSGKTFSVSAGETLKVDMDLLVADTFLNGRITKEGGSPGGTFVLNCWSARGSGWSWTTNDSNGYFSLPAISQDSNYRVRVEFWGSQYDSIPNGCILETGNNDIKVQLGDSILFNMIPKPSGGISGKISNNSSFTVANYSVRVFAFDSSTNDPTGPSFEFNTKDTGNYVFAGIPAGQYVIEASVNTDPWNSWDWKLRKFFPDSTGNPAILIIAQDTLANIDFIFTDADTNGNPKPKGNSLISGQITNIDSPFKKRPVIVLLQNFYNQ
ncbi:MAG: carboxypeptidase-like regulatory domain-containing protein [bacterium]